MCKVVLRQPCLRVASKKNNLVYRSLIRFITEERKKPKKMDECMMVIYRDSDDSSYYTVQLWSKQGEVENQLKIIFILGDAGHITPLHHFVRRRLGNDQHIFSPFGGGKSNMGLSQRS